MHAALAILFVIFFVAIIVVANKRTQQIAGAWKQAAERLGLEYVPGKLFGRRCIQGRRAGLKVRVETYTQSTGKSSTTYTRYRVGYSSLGLGLRLSRQGALSGLGRLFGAQDIDVGHADFDRHVVVKAEDDQSVRAFLTASRRLRIQRFLSGKRSRSITDTEVRQVDHGQTAQARRIETTVRDLCQLAQALTAEEPSVGTFERGLEAQREGRLEEALDLVQSVGAEGPDSDAELLQGEILYNSGRFAEAAEVFERLSEERPDDREVTELAAQSRNHAAVSPSDGERGERERESRDSEPAREETAPFEQREPSPERARGAPAGSGPAGSIRTGSAPTGLGPPEVASVCAELFAAGSMSYDTNRLFESRYEGRRVRWSGRLRRLDSYYSDLIFGQGPGTRAVFEIGEVQDDAYGGRMVQAVVQLAAEAAQELQARVGEEFAFGGILVRCDAFVRNLFVARGEL